ncbi:MAG: class I SAM-dependent methyltransferase [Melioribacteraceae bacterium]
MAVSGKFNTDSKALVNRINAHDKFGSKNINEWIFQHMELSEGLKIVDLGCGTGRQSIPLAQAVGQTGNVQAVDISQESLDILIEESRKKNVSDIITVLHSDFDNLKEHLASTKYERVLASFSVYYSSNADSIFKIIHESLKPCGIFFFCGPSKENNNELKTFISDFSNISQNNTGVGSDFMENNGQVLAKKYFTNIRVSKFENPLIFDSANSLYSYWCSYNLYDEQLDEKFRAAAEKHFEKNSFFVTKKRVIGVKAIKF